MLAAQERTSTYMEDLTDYKGCQVFVAPESRRDFSDLDTGKNTGEGPVPQDKTLCPTVFLLLDPCQARIRDEIMK